MSLPLATPELVRRIALISAQLAEFYEVADVAVWFDSPQRIFGGELPSRLIQSDEGYQRVLDSIERLRDGAYI